jgi:hypothetical protein
LYIDLESIKMLTGETMNETPRTDYKSKRILEDLGPNNNGRFHAMADFARLLERELNILKKEIQDLRPHNT